MIDITKQYTTRSGLPVKLYDIVTDTNQPYPVIGAFYFYDEDDNTYKWVADSWTLDGYYDRNLTNNQYNLIEVTTHNFVKDQLVKVWDDSHIPKLAYFARYDSKHGYMVWANGKTSITGKEVAVYPNCEPYYPTPESKPLQEGELVVVWDNFRFDKTNFDSYHIRRFVSKTKDNKAYITSTHFDDLSNTFIWDNCVRLSEFKL